MQKQYFIKVSSYSWKLLSYRVIGIYSEDAVQVILLQQMKRLVLVRWSLSWWCSASGSCHWRWRRWRWRMWCWWLISELSGSWSRSYDMMMLDKKNKKNTSDTRRWKTDSWWSHVRWWLKIRMLLMPNLEQSCQKLFAEFYEKIFYVIDSGIVSRFLFPSPETWH